jgi:hypothetical protein
MGWIEGETKVAARWRGLTVMRRVWKWALPLGLALMAPASQALAQEGTAFDRLSTVRHEVTVSRSRGGQAGDMPGASSVRGHSSANPLGPYASRSSGLASSSGPYWSLGQPSRGAAGPPSVQVRSTPHTFYPGMRGAQGPNASLLLPRRSTQSRSGVLAPGIFSPGAGMMGPAPLPNQIRR